MYDRLVRRSKNTMNLTIKYPRFNKKIRKSQVVTWPKSRPVIGSNNLVMRNIEYRKCSIPKFQYYWILKMFNTEISILLNIENVQYWIFNTIEYRKKFQSQTSIIPIFFFSISPHHSWNKMLSTVNFLSQYWSRLFFSLIYLVC